MLKFYVIDLVYDGSQKPVSKNILFTSLSILLETFSQQSVLEVCSQEMF